MPAKNDKRVKDRIALPNVRATNRKRKISKTLLILSDK